MTALAAVSRHWQVRAGVAFVKYATAYAVVAITLRALS